jgi:hypothetical protein
MTPVWWKAPYMPSAVRCQGNLGRKFEACRRHSTIFNWDFRAPEPGGPPAEDSVHGDSFGNFTVFGGGGGGGVGAFRFEFERRAPSCGDALWKIRWSGSRAGPGWLPHGSRRRPRTAPAPTPFMG